MLLYCYAFKFKKDTGGKIVHSIPQNIWRAYFLVMGYAPQSDPAVSEASYLVREPSNID